MEITNWRADMPEELTPLPCPFCGDSAFLYLDGDMEGHSVMCRGVADPNCASNAFWYSSEADAIAAWNRRAQPAPSITEHQSKWGRLYTAANALIAAIGFHGRLDTDSPEVKSLQDKLHDLDSGEWMPGLMPAQPEPAAPSVAPEPVAWRVRNRAAPNYWVIFQHKPVDALKDYAREVQPLFAHPPREASVAPEPPRSAQLMICTGCGRQSDDEPIKPQALACCPDNRYRTLRELLSEIDTLRRVHPPRAPLTDERLKALYEELQTAVAGHATPFEMFTFLTRAIEAAHGIRGQG
jgi:hypothetical protein